MTSLWTPDGERRINEQAPSTPPAVAPQGQSPGRGEAPENDPELLAEMAELEKELLEVPVGDVVANHCYGLFQLAALHLAQRPARLADAKVAIDALGAIIEALGPRLGDSAANLTDGLAQVRLAFVEIAKAQPPVQGATAPNA